MKKGFCLLAVAMTGAVLAAPAYAQTAVPAPISAQGESPQLRVAAIIAPPFVLEQNGSLAGFSIELWNAIAARLKLDTNYQIMRSPSALEDAVRSKRADLTVAPVFVTSARDEIFDFSYPILEAGLQIMVRDTGERMRAAVPLLELLRLLFSRTTVLWLGIALLLVLIPAHLVWLIERRHQGGMISNQN